MMLPSMTIVPTVKKYANRARNEGWNPGSGTRFAILSGVEAMRMIMSYPWGSGGHRGVVVALWNATTDKHGSQMPSDSLNHAMNMLAHMRRCSAHSAVIRLRRSSKPQLRRSDE